MLFHSIRYHLMSLLTGIQVTDLGKISQNCPKMEEIVISQMSFHPLTSHLVPMYNIGAFNDKGDSDIDQSSRSNLPQMCNDLSHWPYLRWYFPYRLHTWYQDTTDDIYNPTILLNCIQWTIFLSYGLYLNIHVLWLLYLFTDSNKMLWNVIIYVILSF